MTLQPLRQANIWLLATELQPVSIIKHFKAMWINSCFWKIYFSSQKMFYIFSFVFQASESWKNEKATSEWTILQPLCFCGQFLLFTNSSSWDRKRGAYLPFEMYFWCMTYKYVSTCKYKYLFPEDLTRKIEVRLLHSLCPGQSQQNWEWCTSVWRHQPPTSLNRQENTVKYNSTIRQIQFFYFLLKMLWNSKEALQFLLKYILPTSV